MGQLNADLSSQPTLLPKHIADVYHVKPNPFPLAFPSAALNHPVLQALALAQHGSIVLKQPGQPALLLGDAQSSPIATFILHSHAPLDRFIREGEIGLAESYMDGEWESDDLSALLRFGLDNADTLEKFFYGRPFFKLWTWVRAMLSRNTRHGSRRNIRHHYDLGNDFYRLWLDESMTYSCALFGGRKLLTLEQAQQAKYTRILDRLDARPNSHILDIGCGWGAFAVAAARRGYRVTGVTVSEEQKSFAEKRIADLGLSNRIVIRLQDYRDVQENSTTSYRSACSSMSAMNSGPNISESSPTDCRRAAAHLSNVLHLMKMFTSVPMASADLSKLIFFRAVNFRPRTFSAPMRNALAFCAKRYFRLARIMPLHCESGCDALTIMNPR